MSHGIPLAIFVKNGYTIGAQTARAPARPEAEGGAPMGEEYGPDFITVTDEDGNDMELELLDALEHKGQTYMAFYPAVEEGADEEDEDYGIVILKTIVEDGEELLSTLDSDEELNEVYDLFMERLFQDGEE